MMRLIRIVTLALILLASTAWPGAVASEQSEATATGGEAVASENTAVGSDQKQTVKTDERLFERLKVVGSAAAKSAGSVAVIEEAELRKQAYSDVQRMLRLVPGVNLQDEEGYGLRPNIGMRGSGAERSSKITLLEDGVLIAPAPYSAPAAYYFPTAGRMESIEVRKGSSSIRQGPYTNGGALNLISSSIPSVLGGNVELAGGSDDTFRGRARIGGSTARFGWLAETFRMQSDGFKRLDTGGPTGFELTDYLVKLRVTSSPQSSRFQALELKLGKTEQIGNETYLGLTEADFDRNPYRRYAGSSEDRLDTDHEQVQLLYMMRFNRHLDFTATLYHNDFFRNWRKLQSVEGRQGVSNCPPAPASCTIGIGDVLEQPGSFARELAILRGEVDSEPDSLRLRNNRRNYYSEGLQTVIGVDVWSGSTRHEVEVGLRYHRDEEDRFQEEDRYGMFDGAMELTALGDPGSQSNRINRASAWALFLQDRISLGRWTVTPGARLELIEFSRLDYGRNDPERSAAQLVRTDTDVREFIPGIGAYYQLNHSSGLLAGVHRGFAPPGPGADDRTDPEESINYELGYRRNDGRFDLQVVGFFNDYDNLLGSDTLSSGGSGSGDQFNGGKARVSGLELGASYRLAPAAATYELPLTLAYTYTRGEFRTDFDTDFEGWGSEVRAGDELPYLPPHALSLGLGWIRNRWSAFGNVSYADQMRTQPGQGAIPDAESTDSHVSLDLTLNRELRPGLGLQAQVRNATDEVYVAARRPAGVRPGLPRTVFVGVNWDF